MLSVLTILWTATALSAQSTRLCREKNGQSVSRDALSFDVVQLGLSDTTYTWQATRGRGNITVEYSDDVNVRFTEQGKKLTVTASGSQTSKAVGVPSYFPIISIITCVYFVLCLGDRKWFFWASLTIIVVCSFSMATEDSCLDKGSIHLLIPVESIETICSNDVCKPVLCKLSPFSDYSSLPSNTRVLFEDDFCAINKPERWDEWIEYYFGSNSTADYYGDFDGDGLVNILEYYGASAFKNAFVIGYGQDERWQSTTPISTTTTTTLPVRERRDLIPISEFGTNPLSADSDGDLLQDGFELFNGLNPKAKDVTSGDYDNDLLDNLKEQILRTDPRNPDSDGDGIPDGTEVQTGGNPRNPADKGQKPPNKLTADVQLTGMHGRNPAVNISKSSFKECRKYLL